MLKECFFDDRESLFSALLDDCVQQLQTALQHRPTASFMVSGGSSPKPLYQQLSEQKLDWSRVNVALVDERWVGADHPASNEAFIQQHLLQAEAAAANFVAMKTAHATALDGQQQCEQQYQQLARPFDLTILGMGSDGHTASLFPAAEGLQQALDSNNRALCAAIMAKPSEVTGDFTERMTLSFHGLMQSRQLHLLITGEEKLAVYQQAMANSDTALLPVSALLQQQAIPISVYWAP
jgi:6-phosphogluconolactonase